MEVIAVAIGILLTIVNAAAIIYRRNKNKRIRLKRLSFNQSSLHRAIRHLLPSNAELRKPKKSQAKNHKQNKTIKVVYTPDQKAYWIAGNTFYCADLIDGELDPSSGRPIDTQDLSKRDIEKLLFILDNLNG